MTFIQFENHWDSNDCCSSMMWLFSLMFCLRMFSRVALDDINAPRMAGFDVGAAEITEEILDSITEHYSNAMPNLQVALQARAVALQQDAFDEDMLRQPHAPMMTSRSLHQQSPRPVTMVMIQMRKQRRSLSRLLRHWQKKMMTTTKTLLS